jgi:hypothetical protein
MKIELPRTFRPPLPPLFGLGAIQSRLCLDIGTSGIYFRLGQEVRRYYLCTS